MIALILNARDASPKYQAQPATPGRTATNGCRVCFGPERRAAATDSYCGHVLWRPRPVAAIGLLAAIACAACGSAPRPKPASPPRSTTSTGATHGLTDNTTCHEWYKASRREQETYVRERSAQLGLPAREQWGLYGEHWAPIDVRRAISRQCSIPPGGPITIVAFVNSLKQELGTGACAPPSRPAPPLRPCERHPKYGQGGLIFQRASR